MKNIILFLLLVIGVVFISSCEKEPTTPNIDSNVLLLDEQPISLVGELESTLTLPEVTDINDEDPLITDYPAFLDYDPFTVVTTRTNSADSCLRGLEVTKAQKEQLTTVFKNKIECQRANKVLISKIHREIESWAKNQKQSYYKNWYLVEKGKIEYDLKLGVITQIEYNEKIMSLEKTWKSKMNYLNTQVREKIQTNTQKAEAIGKIRDCEKTYLESVMTILGREKYKKWISCYKYHYKNKK